MTPMSRTTTSYEFFEERGYNKPFRAEKMTDVKQNLHNFLEILECESRKRKYLFGEKDFPPAKRQKLIAWASKRFQERCRKYHERKRKILIGLTLYWESKIRDARRMARKRQSSELYTEYEGFLMAKYPKLVLEPPTVAHPATPATSAANKMIELEAAKASTVKAAAAVETTLEATKTLATEATPKLEANVKDEVSPLPKKRRLIKRLPENIEENEVTEIKVTVPRRKRWRKKGEKRS